MGISLLELILLLLVSVGRDAKVNGNGYTNTRPGCQYSCGNVRVPYPFGIGEGCFISRGYFINCNTSFQPARAFLSTSNLEVVEISPIHVRIKNWVAYSCYAPSGSLISRAPAWIRLGSLPFTFSNTANKFTVVGCDTAALLQGSEDLSYTSGCISLCNNTDSVINGTCSGVGCCQTNVPRGLRRFETVIGNLNNHTRTWQFNSCSYAFLADEESYTFEASDLSDPTFLTRIRNIPVVLDWAVGNRTCEDAISDPSTYACKRNTNCSNSDDRPGYLCFCQKGFEGNPYLDPGCQDINECDDPNNDCVSTCINTPGSYNCTCPRGSYGDGRKQGKGCIPENKEFPVIKVTLGVGLSFLFLLIASSWVYFVIKRRKEMKLREKFFSQNGGLMMQHKLAPHEPAMASAKIFTAEELKLATENYSESRVLGRGGNGIVYKGILEDGRVVAIKKSREVDPDQVEQFINEVVILTQINHRNVVKLLGCCLETEVPLLVYEFVHNGTLYDRIHHSRRIVSISWYDRLRIAGETASALAYLHAAASVPIIHRDVKSANILLDEKFTAKVADFGASRLIPIDQSQITTLVQGTMGYLDPEYFQTSQLTDKSDVYSFGVVLVELMTAQMPVSFARPEAQRNLSAFFVAALHQNRLFQILEERVANEGHREQLIGVAELTRRCLKLRGEDRPSMREVMSEIERLRRTGQHPWLQSQSDEDEDGSNLLQGPHSDLYSVGLSIASMAPGNILENVSFLPVAQPYPRQPSATITDAS